MDNIKSSMVVLILGALILLVSLLADIIGIGDDVGFGRQQTTGVIVGVVVLALGAYLYRKDDQGSGDGPGDASGS